MQELNIVIKARIPFPRMPLNVYGLSPVDFAACLHETSLLHLHWFSMGEVGVIFKTNLHPLMSGCHPSMWEVSLGDAHYP